MTEQRDTGLDVNPRDDVTQQDEDTGAIDQTGTGSMGAGAGAGSMAAQRESAWDEQSAGQTGGSMGQEGVEGGESWEGRNRDIGIDANTTGDAGFGTDTSDDGGPQVDDPATDQGNRTDLS